MTLSGDRHLWDDPHVRLGEVLAGPRIVLVRASEDIAASFAGQATMSLLVDLLARQFDVIDEVWLDVPAAPAFLDVFPRTKPNPGTSLDAALLRQGRDVGGPEISTVPWAAAVPMILVSVGAPSEAQASLITLTCYGVGTAAGCSSDGTVPTMGVESRLPFGPHLAACLAADRVFRALHGVDVRGTFEIDLATYQAPEWSSAGSVDTPTDLPFAYLVGLGAVGAAVLYTLAVAPSIRSRFVGLDFDESDTTSRNRLLSMGYDEIAKSKAGLAERMVEGTSVDFWSNSMRWEEYQTSLHRSTPRELRAREPFSYDWILSAVDKNIARRNLANMMPRHVLAGSTDGLVAQATYYSMIGPCECLACNHPVPSLDLDKLKTELGSLSAAQRSERLTAMGASVIERAAVEDYLRDPSCGRAGEAVLRRLGLADGTDWAVGFVSVAAGIMLAARFWLAASGASDSAFEAEARVFFCGSGSAATSAAVRKEACELCSDANAQASFASRWGIAG